MISRLLCGGRLPACLSRAIRNRTRAKRDASRARAHFLFDPFVSIHMGNIEMVEAPCSGEAVRANFGILSADRLLFVSVRARIACARSCYSVRKLRRFLPAKSNESASRRGYSPTQLTRSTANSQILGTRGNSRVPARKSASSASRFARRPSTTASQPGEKVCCVRVNQSTPIM